MADDFEEERSAGEEDRKDRVTINVSGIKYETYISTLQNVPDTRLAWLTENLSNGTDHKEFFFDRHPNVFIHILNFYRTGRLHTPIDVCGPLFEEELQFWGIDEKQMEPCCWENFTKHREAEVNLRSFEGPGFEDLKKHRKVSVISRERFFKAATLDTIWCILDEPHSSTIAKNFSIISCMIIVISVSIYCLDSMQQIHDNQSWKDASFAVNGFCLVWFTLEFILRCLVCPNKKEFVKSAMNWIDFTSLLPSYLALVLTSSDMWLKNVVIIRLLRLFRFFKLSYGLQVLVHTLKASFYELTLLLLILLIPVVIFSSLVHTVEVGLNPSTTDFRSIPETFWWCLITMTTVGYGDMVPNTWAGKIIGGVCASCGILIVALPISVIGSNFSLYYSHVRARLKLPRKKRLILSGQVRGLLKQPLSLSYRERDRRSIGKHRHMAIIRRDKKVKLMTEPSGSESDHGSHHPLGNGGIPGRQRRHAVFNTTPSEDHTSISDTCEPGLESDHEEVKFVRSRNEVSPEDPDGGQQRLLDDESETDNASRLSDDNLDCVTRPRPTLMLDDGELNHDQSGSDCDTRRRPLSDPLSGAAGHGHLRCNHRDTSPDSKRGSLCRENCMLSSAESLQSQRTDSHDALNEFIARHNDAMKPRFSLDERLLVSPNRCRGHSNSSSRTTSESDIPILVAKKPPLTTRSDFCLPAYSRANVLESRV